MLLYFNLDNFIEILGQLDKGKQREAYYLGICSSQKISSIFIFTNLNSLINTEQFLNSI